MQIYSSFLALENNSTGSDAVHHSAARTVRIHRNILTGTEREKKPSVHLFSFTFPEARFLCFCAISNEHWAAFLLHVIFPEWNGQNLNWYDSAQAAEAVRINTGGMVHV